MSAFTGENITRGKLGSIILGGVQAGTIPAGTPLIVELLDRLSRQDINKTMDILRTFMNAGIDVHTFSDGRVYKGKDFGIVDHMLSGMQSYLSNLELTKKQQRIQQVWANKRNNAATKPITAICPAWLKLASDKKHFEPIKDRVAIIRSIFNDSANGIGNYSITRRLNANGVPALGRSGSWHQSLVAKVLGNKSVLGEFQPHRVTNKKRKPEGDPIANYFPKIIDENLFFRAQHARAQRRIIGAGRKGTNISNLFMGIARCAHCRGRMGFENKGSGPRGGSYLVCDRAKRGLYCQRIGWRYDDFESSFLAFVREIKLEDVLQEESNTKTYTNLQNEIVATRGKHAVTVEKIDRLVELFANAGGAADTVGKKIEDLEQQKTALDDAIRQKENECITLKSNLAEFYASQEQIKTLIKKINGHNSYKVRAEISSRIKALVSTLIISPTEERYFCVGFKDGSCRGVYPSDNDPLRFVRIFGFKDMPPELLSGQHKWLNNVLNETPSRTS